LSTPHEYIYFFGFMKSCHFQISVHLTSSIGTISFLYVSQAPFVSKNIKFISFSSTQNPVQSKSSSLIGAAGQAFRGNSALVRPVSFLKMIIKIAERDAGFLLQSLPQSNRILHFLQNSPFHNKLIFDIANR
jgi:hypothetical protein